MKDKAKENRIKKRLNNGILPYAGLLLSLVMFSFLFIFLMILLRSEYGFELDNNSVALTLIGVLATFIVISNYSQVKDIEARTNSELNKMNGEIEIIKEDYNDLKISLSNMAYQRKFIDVVYFNLWGREKLYNFIDKYKTGNFNYDYAVNVNKNDEYFIQNMDILISERGKDFDLWLSGLMSDYARRKAFPLEDDGTYANEWIDHTKNLTRDKNEKVYNWCVKTEKEIPNKTN